MKHSKKIERRYNLRYFYCDRSGHKVLNCYFRKVKERYCKDEIKTVDDVSERSSESEVCAEKRYKRSEVLELSLHLKGEIMK